MNLEEGKHTPGVCVVVCFSAMSRTILKPVSFEYISANAGTSKLVLLSQPKGYPRQHVFTFRWGNSSTLGVLANINGGI